MVKAGSKPDAAKILSIVPSGKEFLFCSAEGVCSKTLANSLGDFADKLDGIDEVFILFHYPRGDFQAWIRDVLGDNELADRMCFIKPGLSGEKLRQELKQIIELRLFELKSQ